MNTKSIIESQIALYEHRMQAIREVIKTHPEMDNLHTKVAFLKLDLMACELRVALMGNNKVS